MNKFVWIETLGDKLALSAFSFGMAILFVVLLQACSGDKPTEISTTVILEVCGCNTVDNCTDCGGTWHDNRCHRDGKRRGK